MQNLSFLEAGIEVLRLNAGRNMHERQIIKQIKKRRLRELTGQTPHATLSSVLQTYVKKSTARPLAISKVGPAIWTYNSEKAQQQNIMTRLGDRIESCERERREGAMRRVLSNLIGETLASPDLPLLQELKTLAQQLQRIRAQNAFSQKLHSRNEQLPNSVTFVGHTGIGKTFLINCLTRIESPRVSPNDITGGYAWNDLGRSIAERDHMFGLALNTVNSELSLLGIPLTQQRDLLLEACDGLEVDDPARKLVDDLDAVVAQEQRIEEHFLARLHGPLGDGMNRTQEVNANPYLLTTAHNISYSTTSFATHIRYGALPAAILVFKTPEEFEADWENSLENDIPGRYSEQDRQRASELCQRGCEVTIGAGYNFTADRVYVRNRMVEQQQDVAYSLATKQRIILFPDAALRNGSERVDVPGSGDMSPICKQNLEKVMQGAHQIFCVLTRGLENDKSLLELLQRSGIYERLLTDPLNHSIHWVQIMEPRTEPINSLECIDAVNAENDNSEAERVSNLILQQALARAKRALGEDGPELYDSTRCKPKLHRLYPALFVGQCLLYDKLEDEAAKKELLEIMTAAGGPDILGDLYKLGYGYELRATEHFLTEAKKLVNFLAEPAVLKRVQKLLDKIEALHGQLAAMSLEAHTSRVIGRKLIENGTFIFPSSQGNDFDCVLDCKLWRDGEVGGTMIECEHCSHWFHLDCLDLPERNWSKVTWYCPEEECQSQKKSAPQRKQSAPKRVRLH